MSRTYTVVFESDVFRVKEVVEEALEFLSGVFPDLTDDAALEVRLILSEALINAVTHGNDGNINKNVFFKMEAAFDHSLTIQIKDEGEGFDYDSVFESETAEDGFLHEHGRGIKLVDFLSDKVSFNEKGNRINIYKKVILDE